MPWTENSDFIYCAKRHCENALLLQSTAECSTFVNMLFTVVPHMAERLTFINNLFTVAYHTAVNISKSTAVISYNA